MAKIALVCHGIFHCADLASALDALGHDVTIFALESRRKFSRNFNCSSNIIRASSLVPLSIALRLVRRIPIATPHHLIDQVEQLTLKRFGSWAERQLRQGEWDIIYAWSTTAEEILSSTQVKCSKKLVVRGSTHIVAQYTVLKKLSQVHRAHISRPSTWAIQRELREYTLADLVVVLSTYCHLSFTQNGHPEDRVLLMPAGVDTSMFVAHPNSIIRRLTRTNRNAPLRVLIAGTFSFRKGCGLLAEIIDNLEPNKFSFTFMGSIEPECRTVAKSLERRIAFRPRASRSELNEEFQHHDIFFSATLEEGLPQTMAQAAAAGLPIVASDASGASDLLCRGVRGIVFKSADAAAASTALRNALLQRNEWFCGPQAKMKPWSWQDAAGLLINYLEFESSRNKNMKSSNPADPTV